MRALGYAHVTVDLEGYRRGSVNEAPVAIKRPAS
jgi:PP-loop superfamily ATP-utilizing enzyme